MHAMLLPDHHSRSISPEPQDLLPGRPRNPCFHRHYYFVIIVIFQAAVISWLLHATLLFCQSLRPLFNLSNDYLQDNLDK